MNHNIKNTFIAFGAKHVLMLAILSLFFLAQFINLREHTQSFKFGDESEHLALGWMIANYNSKLFQEISTNHQPVPIVASYIFFETIDYPNLFMLIERLRQFMFAISFLGAVVLVFKFGLVGIISSILVGTVSFWLFGYHLLAESLVLYPIIFIMGVTAKSILWKSQKSQPINKIEPILFGFCVFLTGFSLLPSVPFLLFASIVYFYQAKAQDKKLVLLSTSIPTILLFLIVDPIGWFNRTILDNIKYFLPYETGPKDLRFFISILFYPFQSLFNYSGPVAKYYLFLTLLFVISTVIVLKNSKTKKFLLKIFFLYFLIVLLNLRISKIDVGFYTAFHVLPHLGAFTILTVLLLKLALEELGDKTKQKIIIIVSTGALIIGSLIFNTSWWRENADKNQEHFIQYGEIGSLSAAFGTLKQDGDKLLAGELEGLLNIASDLPIAGSQNAYLSWSYRSEESKSKFKDMLENRPPTFIYFIENDTYFLLLKPYLESDYTRLQRYDGALTNAYMKTSEIPQRTEEQWRKFESLFYKIPDDVNL